MILVCDSVLRHYYSYAFELTISYLGLWISNRTVNWPLRMLSYDLSETLFCAYNRYNYQWLVPRSMLELLKAPPVVLRYLMSGGFVASSSGEKLSCVALDFFMETRANRELKPSFTHPDPEKFKKEVSFLPYRGRCMETLKGFMFPDTQKLASTYSRYKLWPEKQRRLTKVLVCETTLFKEIPRSISRPLSNIFTGQIATAKEAEDTEGWHKHGEQWKKSICKWLDLEHKGQVAKGTFNNTRTKVLSVMKLPKRQRANKLQGKVDHLENTQQILLKLLDVASNNLGENMSKVYIDKVVKGSIGFEQLTVLPRGWFTKDGAPIFRDKSKFREALSTVGGMEGFGPLPQSIEGSVPFAGKDESEHVSHNLFSIEEPSLARISTESHTKIIDAWVLLFKNKRMYFQEMENHKKSLHEEKLETEHGISDSRRITMLDYALAVSRNLSRFFAVYQLIFFVFDREDIVDELGLKDAMHLKRQEDREKRADDKHVCTFRCSRPFDLADDFPGSDEVLRPCRKLHLRKLLSQFLMKFFSSTGILYICGHQLGSSNVFPERRLDSFPIAISSRSYSFAASMRNNHGEADFSMFFYAAHTPSKVVVISSVDTDIWVTAILLSKHDRLISQKHLFVETQTKSRQNEGTALNLTEVLTSLPAKLSPLNVFSVGSVSGNDYIPYLQDCGKLVCLRTFLTHFEFVSADGPLATIRNTHGSVSNDCFLRFIFAFFVSSNADSFPKGVTPATELSKHNGDLKAAIKSLRAKVAQRWIARPEKQMPTVTACIEQVKRATVHLNLALSATSPEPFIRCAGPEHGYWRDPITGVCSPTPDHPETLAEIEEFLKVTKSTSCTCTTHCTTFRCTCLKFHNKCHDTGAKPCTCTGCENPHNQGLPCHKIVNKKFDCPYHEFYGKTKKEMKEILWQRFEKK